MINLTESYYQVVKSLYKVSIIIGEGLDRRNFIKATVITAAGAAVIGKTINIEGINKTGGKKMKILVITGSPRKNGNSNILADNFIKGAQESGHSVVRFDSAFKTVHPCIACNKCGMNGECAYKDDFEFVKANIADADCVVFATPMYYFGISSQIKSVIDRFYAINDKIHVSKKAVLLMTYADTSERVAQPIISHYESLLRYLGWTDAGRVIASGVWSAGDVKHTQYPEKAYDLGKNI